MLSEVKSAEAKGGGGKKQIYLAISIVIFALLSFYLLKIGLLKPIFIIFGLIIFPMVWGIGAFLIESPLIILITSLAVTAIFLLSWGFSLIYLICGALLLFSLLWGFKKVQKEKKLRIKVLIEEIVPKGIGWLFFVFSIILAAGFYFSPTGQGLKEGISIPTWAQEKILTTFVPGFSKDLTVDQMLNVLMKKEKDEPVSEKNREQILKQLDMEDLKLSGEEKISQRPEILDRLISGRINQVLKGFAEYIPIVAAFLIWQIFLILNKILIPIVTFFDLLIYSILKKVGFVKIKKKSVEKEEILL